MYPDSRYRSRESDSFAGPEVAFSLPIITAAPLDIAIPEAEAPEARACGTGCGCRRVGPGPTRGAWTALGVGVGGGFAVLVLLYWLIAP